MKIKVEHLGYIHKGEVNLDRNLTVFIGKNQTGKTYLNYTLFSLFAWSNFNLSNEIFHPHIDELIKTDFCKINLEDFFNLHQDQINKDLSDELKELLPQFFALNESLFEDTQISFQGVYRPEIIAKNLEVFWQERRFMNPVVTLVKPKNEQFVLEVKFSRKELLRTRDLEDYLGNYFSNVIQKIIFPTPYFTLAERSAFNLFFRQFSLILGRRVQGKGRKKVDIATKTDEVVQELPYPIFEYLFNLNPQRSKKGIETISKYLEEKIIQGAVMQNDDGSFTFHTKSIKPNTKGGHDFSLPLHGASSLVKSLAYFDVLIREQLLPGNIVFIDEPEINLHPDNQYHLARVIAMLANAGVKVVVSTHSLTFLQELNNLMMLAQLYDDSTEKKKICKEAGYTPEMELSPNRVRAYLFDDNTIKELAVTPSGINTQVLRTILGQLNDFSYHLFNALKNQPERGEDDE